MRGDRRRRRRRRRKDFPIPEEQAHDMVEKYPVVGKMIQNLGLQIEM